MYVNPIPHFLGKIDDRIDTPIRKPKRLILCSRCNKTAIRKFNCQKSKCNQNSIKKTKGAKTYKSELFCVRRLAAANVENKLEGT